MNHVSKLEEERPLECKVPFTCPLFSSSMLVALVWHVYVDLTEVVNEMVVGCANRMNKVRSPPLMAQDGSSSTAVLCTDPAC